MDRKKHILIIEDAIKRRNDAVEHRKLSKLLHAHASKRPEQNESQDT